jgi:hypothetical protein
MEIGAIDVHHVLLIAASPIARALEDEASPVGTEVRFRILAAVGELAQVVEVALSGLGGADEGRRT